MKIYAEIEKSFPTLEKLFTPEGYEEFKTTKLADLYRYHFGLGTWIRNNLLYSKENILHSLFIENGIKHYDEMTSFIHSIISLLCIKGFL